MREQRSAAELCCPCSASASGACAPAGACPGLLRTGLVGTLHEGSLKQSQQQGGFCRNCSGRALDPLSLPTGEGQLEKCHAVLVFLWARLERTRGSSPQTPAGGSLQRGCCSEWEEPRIFSRPLLLPIQSSQMRGEPCSLNGQVGLSRQSGACRPAVRDTEAKACLPRKEQILQNILEWWGNTVCPQDRNYSFIFAILLMFNF